MTEVMVACVMIYDVVCAGDVNIDLILASTPEAPLYGREIVLPTMELRTGGSTTNTVIALARLGLKTCFIGKIPKDIFGRYLFNELQGFGVNCLLIKAAPKERTGITVSVAHESGERAMISYLGTNATLTLDEVKQRLKSVVGGHFHVGGLFLLQGLKGEPAIELFKMAKKKGMSTSLDVGWDVENWPERNIEALHNTLKHVDMFFPNESEVTMAAKIQDSFKASKTILRSGPRMVVTKLGEKGCYVVTREKTFHVPAFKVKAVETTGVGDVFNAAFIYGYLKGWHLETVALFANAAGAISASSIKIEATYPLFTKVMEFLEKRNVKFPPLSHQTQKL